MRRMSSSVAMSPAMTAAGSPGVRYRSENTTNATTAITMTVENRRRTMYAIIRRLAGWSLPGKPLFLLDVPHEVDRRNDHAGEIRAISGWKNELRGGNVRHEFIGAHLHRVGGLFR